MNKHLAKILTLVLVLPIIFIGCQKSELTDDSKISNPESTTDGILKSTTVFCGTPFIADLVDFEQTFTAGIVTVGNDETTLYVTYELTGEWWIHDAVLFAGPASEAGTIYQDGSGQFSPSSWVSPYRHNFFPYDYVQSHTFEIDLSTLDECFIIVAYSKATNLTTNQNKFIWGKSQMKSSGYYLEYCKQECTPPPPPPPLGGCETAYAYGENFATCFLEIPGVNSNNWGWSNGTITAGSYSWPLYAGAGQCNIGNGIHVGTLQVNYTPPTAVVTYTMFNGYVLNETHLYVGNQILPKKKNKFTTVPGQFPCKHENLNGVSSDTFTINGLSGNIYVVAHSVACDDI
jgi:hypothetical protein